MKLQEEKPKWPRRKGTDEKRTTDVSSNTPEGKYDFAITQVACPNKNPLNRRTPRVIQIKRCALSNVRRKVNAAAYCDYLFEWCHSPTRHLLSKYLPYADHTVAFRRYQSFQSRIEPRQPVVKVAARFFISTNLNILATVRGWLWVNANESFGSRPCGSQRKTCRGVHLILSTQD